MMTEWSNCQCQNNLAYLYNPDFADKSNTSLHLAALHGHVDIVRLLIALGHDSCTPILLKTGDDSAPGISLNTDSETPLHLAAANAHPACVHYLCHAFPHAIDWPDRNGMTPLMLAAQSSNPANIIPHDPSLIEPRSSRARAASSASAAEDTSTLSVLLSHRASVTCVDFAGNTALHHASAWGNLKAVRVLLASGAQPLALNKASYTPLDYSISGQAAQYYKNLIVWREEDEIEDEVSGEEGERKEDDDDEEEEDDDDDDDDEEEEDPRQHVPVTKPVINGAVPRTSTQAFPGIRLVTEDDE
ncbi:hypothetical protein DTO271D3_3457 [Paecilomyces variotii]|nr:hypothetical protein DTO271D3_3457 [Paecilomyces variotii]